MRQMHNNGVMENLASRLQELDKQILEIPDIAHATHKSNEEQQNVRRWWGCVDEGCLRGLLVRMLTWMLPFRCLCAR